jgi:hypothetical protein
MPDAEPLRGPNGSPRTARVAAFFVKYPASALSLVYLYLCIIGGVRQGYLLWSFGINYFRYAQVSDIFLAGVSDPFLTVMGLMSVGMLVLLEAAVGLRGRGTVPLLAMLVFSVLLVWPVFASIMSSSDVKNGWGTYAQLGMSGEVDSTVKRLAAGSSLLVGKTDDFLFLFTPQDSSSFIIPTASIRWMKLCTIGRPAGPSVIDLPIDVVPGLIGPSTVQKPGTSCHKQEPLPRIPVDHEP